MKDLLRLRRSASLSWKSERMATMFGLVRSHNFLKKDGPNPSGLGLAFGFMSWSARMALEG